MTRVLLATFALLVPVSVADAKRHHSIESLVRHAHGNPWRCDFDHDGKYGPKQNHCVVRVVFKRDRRAGREAESIITCESGWDEKQVTPPYSASGLAQFLPSTWRRTKYGAKNVFHPVWNVMAMRWLYHQDGESWHEWSCARIVGV